MIEVVDFKGDYWLLRFGAVQLHKRTNRHCVLWRVVSGPKFLQTNGARYDIIPTPIFMEWWT